MKILAIETSCDETAIAVAEFRHSRGLTRTHLQTDADKNIRVNVLSHIISSQAKLHAKFGGVVPNLAKREHQRNLAPILVEALKESGLFKRVLRIPYHVSRRVGRMPRNAKYGVLDIILEREPELLTRFKKYITPIAPPEIDAVAVTYGPGLAPALWVGVNFARALAYLWDKPLMPVNHMEGHLFSALLQESGKKNSKFQNSPPRRIPGLRPSRVKTLTLDPSSKFPAVALLVSGGHTELVLMRGYGKYKIIGETLDDAAGEAFDKVARILGLGYPGGPEISRLAAEGDPRKYPLPSPMINTKDYNFSFSGLKTAVLYFVRDSVPYLVRYRRRWKADLAASFEKAVVDVLVKKTIRAAKAYRAKTMLLGGGVAANASLREKLGEAVRKENPNSCFLLPDSSLTGDNALMIATAAYFTGKKKAQTEVGADANAKLGTHRS